MEDVKWLLRKCGLPILLLLIFVIAGVSYRITCNNGNQRPLINP